MGDATGEGPQIFESLGAEKLVFEQLVVGDVSLDRQDQLGAAVSCRNRIPMTSNSNSLTSFSRSL